MIARTPEICIVGAETSRLRMGIQLENAGLMSFRSYENADSVGSVPITRPSSAKRFHKDVRRPRWDDFELIAS